MTARSRWNSAGKVSLLTRQSIQVAVAGTLAILAGRELSQARYYWAVLAAFVAFAGTATRSETFIKATNRVVGTLVGLGAGIGLAHLTSGHTYWIIFVIILSMSCGFYLVSISYAAMIFFVTIMVSQLYSELHEFSASLLALRLEETAIGAAIGIAVALVVLPTSTRDTVNSARSRYYTALGELLHASAARLEAGSAETVTGPAAGAGGADLDALIRVVDHRMQQLALVAKPLTRPLLWGNDSRLARHRLTLLLGRHPAAPRTRTGAAPGSRSGARPPSRGRRPCARRRDDGPGPRPRPPRAGPSPRSSAPCGPRTRRCSAASRLPAPSCRPSPVPFSACGSSCASSRFRGRSTTTRPTTAPPAPPGLWPRAAVPPRPRRSSRPTVRSTGNTRRMKTRSLPGPTTTDHVLRHTGERLHWDS